MNDIMKIVKSLEEFDLLVKGVSEQLEKVNEQSEQVKIFNAASSFK